MTGGVRRALVATWLRKPSRSALDWVACLATANFSFSIFGQVLSSSVHEKDQINQSVTPMNMINLYLYLYLHLSPKSSLMFLLS